MCSKVRDLIVNGGGDVADSKYKADSAAPIIVILLPGQEVKEKVKRNREIACVLAEKQDAQITKRVSYPRAKAALRRENHGFAGSDEGNWNNLSVPLLRMTRIYRGPSREKAEVT
jgi:hypothetical protein